MPTHPPSSLDKQVFDVICLGSGWAGRVLAARCVASGLSALIVEKELIGGDCPFWACIPSKALLRPAEALDDARQVGGARERLSSTSVSVDAESVFRRRDLYTSGWDDTKVAVPMVESSGAHIVRGVGRITGVKKVNVTLDIGGGKYESIDLEARQAVAICTGSEPIMPDIPGLLDAKPWGPREATSSSVVPESLFIIGGGVLSVEMATVYQSLGSKVILASRTPELLPSVDSQAGEIVRNKLESRGARILTSTEVTLVKRDHSSASVTITLSADGHSQNISTSEILVATGRRPVVHHLGLESIGYDPALIETKSPIMVDESLVVKSISSNSSPWLYAAGDVNGRALLTHTAKYHGRIAANAIIARARNAFPSQSSAFDSFSASADRTAVPQVIFSDPVVASVGLTRKVAEQKGRDVSTVTAPVRTPGATLHAEGYEMGWAQWVLEKDTGVLLGATFVGSEVSDLLHASTVAIVGAMRVEQLVHAIPCFPTMSEVYLNLVDAAGV
ncbi:hypothetical protein SLS60_009963 [Paraconiothyrium brasiliense]|uniref:Uncharacterized protein n=1 Tax=Paraconiothyrium brasiliense TaxID=300254 RepID=A0ABR3QT77_9PLEO